jgi:hypothetical protein
VTITEVAAEVREKVIAAVERMAGLEVVEVNIAVNDVHLPDDGAPESSDNRGGAGGVLDGRLPRERLVAGMSWPLGGRALAWSRMYVARTLAMAG